MYIKGQTLAFSGHRSNKLPQSENDMEKLRIGIYNEIDKALKDGFDTFIFGACYGFDLMCAEMVLLRKSVITANNPQNIRLIAAVPFEEQASKWNEQDREIYFNTLAKCDEVITLSTHYSMDCYHKRNRYMIDNSSRLICYYNGSGGGTAYTVKYAEEKGLEIINLYGEL